MAVDWAAVRAALASLAAGASGIREATSTNLTVVTITPCVKVTHVSESQTTDRGMGYEFRTSTVRGHLLVAQVSDVGRAIASVEEMAENLVVAHRTGVKLGIQQVQDSYLESWEAGSYTYNGIEYAGAGLVYKVLTRENVTRTA